MSTPAFGWAVVNKNGDIFLPVYSNRVESIARFVSSMDETVPGPEPTLGTALGREQENAWCRDKRRYGMRCIRVHVEPAFGSTLEESEASE